MNPFWLLDLWRSFWFPFVEKDKRDLQRENYELRTINGILKQRLSENGLSTAASIYWHGQR